MAAGTDALLVAAGGAVGAVSRWLIGSALQALIPAYPFAGTAVVNLSGSFVIGALLPMLPGLPEGTRPLVVAGFLGGLTTMSGYAADVIGLLLSRRYVAAFAHWFGGACLCILACWAGHLLAERLGAPSGR